MINILYSYNKKGYEGMCWRNEIQAASSQDFTFVPFNHQYYLDPLLYSDATKLDCLYQSRNPNLIAMYQEVKKIIKEHEIHAIIVANCPPYHPEFLKSLSIYKALYSADDPGATYLINIPYLHAYDHVFFVNPVYSGDLDMEEKMHYAGMNKANWLPISVFDFEFDVSKSIDAISEQDRDIDIIYVGGFWKQKIENLIALRKKFGKRFRIYGMFKVKHNLYLNLVCGINAWISPITHQQRVLLYQRSKIGVNIHYNKYGLGNQRLYHLPANGVMQISDCGPHLNRIYNVQSEIIAFEKKTDLVEKVNYYLSNAELRKSIAISGYKRTMQDYRFKDVTRRAGKLIQEGIG